MPAKKKSEGFDGICVTCKKTMALPNTPECRPCTVDSKVRIYGVNRTLAMYSAIRSDDGFSCIRCGEPIPETRSVIGDNKTCITCRKALECIDPATRRFVTRRTCAEGAA